jgi:Ran GTPase-activating protein (RanGAP) involved in mRNA processing and transport
MSQLQSLACFGNDLGVDGIRAMQPGLQSNPTLKELHLGRYTLEDDGTRLLVDALVGNTIMELLNISASGITSNDLDDITRMIASMTRVQTIKLHYNSGIFSTTTITKARNTLSLHYNTRVQRCKSCL